MENVSAHISTTVCVRACVFVCVCVREAEPSPNQNTISVKEHEGTNEFHLCFYFLCLFTFVLEGFHSLMGNWLFSLLTHDRSKSRSAKL